jgi:predicted nucleic acid-binding protein
LIVALVVDASVGLKWVLQEQDSHLAEALVGIEPDLLVPDFWLHEATSILWLQVHRKLFTPDEAREALAMLRAQVEPTPTAHMRLHDLALDIGMAIDHSTYDTLYLAFAVAMGASAVVTADASFVQFIPRDPDPALSRMVLSLDAWARSQGVKPPAE